MKFGWLSALLLALCIAIATRAQSRLPIKRQSTALPLAQVHPAILKLLSFGHAQSLADVIYLQAVSLWGDYSSKATTYVDLSPALERVVYLDPYHKGAYLLGGTALTLQGMNAEMGLNLLTEGTRVFPHDWQLLFLYGFNLYDVRHDHEGAARALAQAAVLEGAPQHLAMLAASLSAQSNHEDIGIGMLDVLLQRTSDASERAIYERRMLRLMESKRKQELGL